jgi:hypothetical protein
MRCRGWRRGEGTERGQFSYTEGGGMVVGMEKKGRIVVG